MNQQQPNYQQPAYGVQDYEAQIKSLLSSTKGWLMFIGIMNIIFASIYTLITLGIGIVVMWAPFILGVFLISASAKIKNYLMSGNPLNLIEYHKQMKNFFVTKGVLMIIAFALGIISSIIIAVTGFAINNTIINFPW